MQNITGETPGDMIVDEPFIHVVAALADGMLLFPKPYDLRSSLALALNDDPASASELFDAARNLQRVEYRIRITAHAVDRDDVGPREVIDTRVTDDRVLAAVVNSLFRELRTHPESAELGSALPA